MAMLDKYNITGFLLGLWFLAVLYFVSNAGVPYNQMLSILTPVINGVSSALNEGCLLAQEYFTPTLN